MNNSILVAGATGNLGGKIIDALIQKKAIISAIVRLETNPEKIKALENKGIKVFIVDMTNVNKIAKACEGVNCVISALAGLRETIIDVQSKLLEAAVLAKVPRFIPSDYSIDFTNLIPGQNRNLDLRREFHKYLETKPIQSTSIFNGPFMDLLVTDMPLILFKQKKILCWGNADQVIEFTTTQNVAEFTANASLDNNTPRFLRIAGDRLTCNEFIPLLTELTEKKYKLFRPGGIGLLNFLIKFTRFTTPKSNDLYPAWQGMQYMRDMMEGRIVFQKYDTERYTNMHWTTVKEFLIAQDVSLR